ncbi:MAG TPA: response regulator [Chloroflexi bacterium]|nr:response regulator [Chloroflexota bacterium]
MAKRILVVDDELESVKLIGLMLQRRGYEISAARTGSQALAKIESDHPDLVILDVMMPDMDGYEATRRIRANPETANLPIILFTAKTMVDDKVAGFQAGADDYLTKPIHPEELASRIEAVLLRSTRQSVVERPPIKAKVIGFLGSKGGVGTSTLAVNVAVVLAQSLAKGNQVIFVDMQPGMATTALQLGLRHHEGMAQLVDQPVNRIDAKVVEAQLQEYMTGLRVWAGPTEPLGVTAPIPPDHAEAVVRQLGAMADYLLLDLGVGLGEVNGRILPMCDHVVVPIEPHRFSLVLARALLEQISLALNLADHRIIIVLVNKAPSSSTFNKGMIEGVLQHDLSEVITPAPELAFQAGEQGKPIVMARPTSLVAQQIRSLTEYLLSM